MKTTSRFLCAIILGALSLTSVAQANESRGKILIILSSASELPLQNGKTFATGYYLNELIIPAKALTRAGYELVFADPKGNTPAVDAMSVDKAYFGGSQAALDDALAFQSQEKDLVHPLTLRQAISGGLSQYKAVFVPGGPAPTIDLMADPDAGTILRYFHEHGKITALLCHGPITLLAAANEPASLQGALRSGSREKVAALTANWPYAGYRITIFSNEEEHYAATQAFHGEPLLYPQRALEYAGGKVSVVAAWKPNVIQDRELITGQNPGSDQALVEQLLKTLARMH